MKQIDLLSPRLRFAADRVRRGAVFADVGTDHAKLPIALVEAGRVSFAPTDIAICGMGGETIVGILDAAAFIRDARVQLILQPMTDFSMLRTYLAASGFAVTEEDIVLSEGRMYQCLCAAHTSVPYTLIPIEAELGRLNIEKRTPLFLRYVHRRKAIVEKQIAGKRKAGADAAAELALLDGYNGILEGEYEIT